MTKDIFFLSIIIFSWNVLGGTPPIISEITFTEEELVIDGTKLENTQSVSIRSLKNKILKDYDLDKKVPKKIVARPIDGSFGPVEKNLYLVITNPEGELFFPITLNSQTAGGSVYKITQKKKILVDEKSELNFSPNYDTGKYYYDYSIYANPAGDLAIKNDDKEILKIDEDGNLEVLGSLKVKGKTLNFNDPINFVNQFNPQSPTREIRISDVVIGTDNSISGVVDFASSGNMDVATGTFHVDSINKRVGIGTTNPTYQLDIQGAANAGIRLKQASPIENTLAGFFSGLVLEGPSSPAVYAVGQDIAGIFQISYFDGGSSFTKGFTLSPAGDGFFRGDLAIRGQTTFNYGTAESLTFPINRGTDGQVLTTNGAGIATWATPATGTGGSGDVAGPATATIDNLASFSDGSGNVIKDSGINSANIPLMTAGAISANQIIISAGANKELKTTLYPIPETIGASGTVLKSDGTNAIWELADISTDHVIGPAISADNSLARFDLTTGKLIQDSGVTIDDTNNISGIEGFTSTGDLLVGTSTFFVDSVGNRVGIGKTNPTYKLDIQGSNNSGIRLKQASPIDDFEGSFFSGLVLDGPATNAAFGLGHDGAGLFHISFFNGNTSYTTAFTLSPLGDGFFSGKLAVGGQTTFNSGTANSLTFPTNRGTNGQVLVTNGLGATNWISAGSGDVSGPAVNSTNTLAMWDGANSKTLRETPYSFPTTLGIGGQGLVSNGTGSVDWADVGDVKSLGSFTPGAVAVFSNGSGKTLIDTGLLQGNVVQMTALPLTPNQMVLTTLASKELGTTSYTMPPTIGSATYALKSDGTNVTWQADAGVVLNSTFSNVQDNLPVFANPEGTEIGDSGVPVETIVRMAADATGTNYPIISQGANKEVMTAPYKIPTNACPSGQGMVFDGTDLVCSNGSLIVDWKPNTAYNVGDKVLYNNNDFVRCITAHTSGTSIIPDFSKWDYFSLQDIGTGIFEWTAPYITYGSVSNTLRLMAGYGIILTGNNGTKQNFLFVEWPTMDNITVMDIVISGETHIFINTSGQVVQQTTLSSTDIQNKLKLGTVFHKTPGFIDNIAPFTTVGVNTNTQFNGLQYNLGIFKTEKPDNVLYSTTPNLTLARSAGELNWPGSNPGNLMQPNTFSLPSQPIVNFDYYNRDGFLTSRTTLNPGQYDNNGTLSNVSNNNFSIQRLFLLPNGDTAVLYDQKTYSTLSGAINDLSNPNIVFPPALKSGVFFLGQIILKGNTTVTNNVVENALFNCSKFGCGTGTGSGEITALASERFAGPAFSSINHLAIFADGSGKVLAESSFAPPSTAGSRGQVLTSNGDGTTKWGAVSSVATRTSLPSDRKLKKEIRDLTDSYIDKIMDLRPVSFVWKDTLHSDLGFIAQEVKKVFPGLVEEDAGYMGVNYQKMVVPLVKAFQEQQKEIEKYQSIISKLEARIEKLEMKSSN